MLAVVVSVLVDFFYAPPVGHAIEALHHALALHRADPSREVSVVLNAATPTELAACCPFLTAAYAVDAPFAQAAPAALESLRHIPRDWDWVLSDARRDQAVQGQLFPGLLDHYRASDAWFGARLGRGRVGETPPTRRRHVQLRLRLPAEASAAAGWVRHDGPLLALMPAGAGQYSDYPSVGSWLRVLDSIAAAQPDLGVVLVGRSGQGDRRTSTSFSGDDFTRLMEHPAVRGDVVDRPLLEQLAVVERCRVFLSPHTGFGMAALAVATPWLAISGGRWFEWYFNRVPFRSIVPDTRRYPAYSQFQESGTVHDGPDGARIPSMTQARIIQDLPRILTGLDELLHRRISYRDCLQDYARDLRAAHDDDPTDIWSFDAVLDPFLWAD